MAAFHAWGHHGPPETPQIVPTKHDVLSGRGVNIAQLPGNERFRALVNSRYDPNYCSQYSTTEKRAVAREIIAHIQSLDPPGRFLRRVGRARNARGLEGPWEELSEMEAIKKTVQALRDCNRPDRSGYAGMVAVPDDVRRNQEIRSQTGLSNKQYAEQAAANIATAQRQAADSQPPPSALAQPPVLHSMEPTYSMGSMTHHHHHHHPEASHFDHHGQIKREREDEEHETVSPSLDHAASWHKKPRTDDFDKTPMGGAPTTTPTTAGSSGGMLQETSLLDSVPSSAASQDHHGGYLPPSPHAHFDFPNGPDMDPINLASAAIDEAEQEFMFYGGSTEFAPPSPLHPDHHHTNNGESAHRFDE